MTDRFATLLAHDPDITTGPVAPPIVQTSLFAFESFEALEQAFTGEVPKPIYSRGHNPTVRAFEEKLAALEGADAARGFASGMGAISAAVLSQVQAGDRIVCVRHVYPDTYRLLVRLLPRLGVRVSFVDGRDLDAVEQALVGARLLYLESPTSVVFERHDLAELAALARQAGATTIADNSWASPILQRPLELGVDLVVHSASKYLGGHSDVVAGVVAGERRAVGTDRASHLPVSRRQALAVRCLAAAARPAHACDAHGAPWQTRRWPSPRGWLAILRSPKCVIPASTRDRSMDRRPGTGRRPRTRRRPACSVSSLPSRSTFRAFCNALDLFRLGVSWGGYESLIFPAMVGLQQAGAENALQAFEVSPRLVRLSIGLEGVDDLILDLEGALETAWKL